MIYSTADIEKIRRTPLFFIVGRPRTGSTLLRTLFDAHPNVAIPQEWPMLLALYRRFGSVIYWDTRTLESFYEALFQNLRFPYWEIDNWPSFDAEQLHDSLLKCQGEYSFETLFKVVYSHYSSYFEKKEIILFGDKNPVYSNQTALLARIFPSARFIHLTRDYRDNLASMLEVDFEMPNIALLSYRWKYSWNAIESCAAMYPNRFLTLKYEDLVSDAYGRFQQVCSFLEIPFESSIFTFYEKKTEMEESLPKPVIDRYFKSLFQPIDTSRVGIYKEKLSGFQVRIAGQVIGSIAEKAGYARENKAFSLWIFLWTLPAVLYAKWLYIVGWLVNLLPYNTMMWLLNKPSILVRLYSRIIKVHSKP